MPDEYEELPPRPRRRLLTPMPLALFGVLLTACGFIGGVLVEKGQSPASSSAPSSGFASRFAALRSGAGIARGATAGSSGGGASAGGAAAGAADTIGQVAYASGRTLYVTNAEGNTVKVTTSVASTVSKTVKSDVKGIHPGETVIVTGTAGADGAVDAESIRVSEADASGGLGALFGGGGLRGGLRGSNGASSSSSGSNGASGSSNGAGANGAAAGGGEPALFGK